MADFSDRVVVVTGASGNLGAAVVQAFYTAGAKLVLVDRQIGRLQTIFPMLDAAPDRFLAVSADLTEPDSVRSMALAAVEHFGQIDVLANTVGGYRGGTPLHETPLEAWDFMLNLNVRTALIVSQVIIPHMLERGSGKIVHVAARAGMSGSAKMAVYSAAKSALIRLVESMGAELKHKGINVNCVLPGTIDTPQNREERPDSDYSRWVTPEAIADVIIFLASDAARAINGAAIPVYGRS
jgi:NAD(P)-dependent dehydrogenase (short-subunit alcohol dehydrogenase family)